MADGKISMRDSADTAVYPVKLVDNGDGTYSQSVSFPGANIGTGDTTARSNLLGKMMTASGIVKAGPGYLGSWGFQASSNAVVKLWYNTAASGQQADQLTVLDGEKLEGMLKGVVFDNLYFEIASGSGVAVFNIA